MRRDLIRTTIAVLSAGTALAGCEHAENYRWSGGSRPSFETTLRSPPGSQFGSWDRPAVSVYSFPTPATPPSETSLRDLSPEGQAALIEAFARAGASADELRAALSRPLRVTPPPAAEGAATAEGVYKRTLVANVTEGWSAAPGDRLVWTWIRVRPLNFLFDGYTVIATDNQVLNIEQVTNVSNASLNATLGRTGTETSTTNTAGNPVSSVLESVAGSTSGLTGTVGNTYTTTAAINQQYVKLGADIVPEELRIYRESERNQDVAGNTLIALTMRLDPSSWRGAMLEDMQRVSELDLATDTGAMRRPADVTLNVTMHRAPPRCDLLAEVTLFYQARRATDGRSYVEGEQEATYVQGEYSQDQPVVIVPAGEVRQRSWRVYPRGAPAIALQARNVFGYDLPLDFASFDQAKNFAEWLGRSRGVRGVMHPAIGKSGLTLSSGIDDQVVFEGAYFAQEATVNPHDLAIQCAGTRRSGSARPPAV